jgi:hypothetical protein
MRKALVLVASVRDGVAAAASGLGAGALSADKAKLYYLSVGDSLAAGVQRSATGQLIPDRPRLRRTAPGARQE